MKPSRNWYRNHLYYFALPAFKRILSFNSFSAEKAPTDESEAPLSAEEFATLKEALETAMRDSYIADDIDSLHRHGEGKKSHFKVVTEALLREYRYESQKGETVLLLTGRDCWPWKVYLEKLGVKVAYFPRLSRGSTSNLTLDVEREIGKGHLFYHRNLTHPTYVPHSKRVRTAINRNYVLRTFAKKRILFFDTGFVGSIPIAIIRFLRDNGITSDVRILLASSTFQERAIDPYALTSQRRTWIEQEIEKMPSFWQAGSDVEKPQRLSPHYEFVKACRLTRYIWEVL